MATSLEIDDVLQGRIQNLAIQQYVEREDARESFKQEALDSWAVYQKTGRHLTGQEARAWLNTWGRNPLPLGRGRMSRFSFRNSQEHGQATLNLHQCIHVDVSKSCPYLVALHCHGLVHHHL